MTRRRLLHVLGGGAVVGGGSYLLARSFLHSPTPRAARVPDGGGSYLDLLARNVVSGGPGKDGIPAIDEPRFIPPGEARFLADEDVVFGLSRNGKARAYPQLILVWHEIVNDAFPDGPVSITYCPLTGSVVGFRGTAPNGRPYTFGTSGNLVNSNLLMYDRQTDSRWPQIVGQAILGPSTGGMLEEVPLIWTTWARWRSAHPETAVLSTETGYLRAYGSDPYGSYNYRSQHVLFGYYKPGQGHNLYFPILHEDHRFDEKEVFIGIKLSADHLAVRKSLLRGEGVASARMAGTLLLILYDPRVDDARAFLADVDGQEVPMYLGGIRPGRYIDEPTGSVWDPYGRAVSGPLKGTALRSVPSFDVMWFAWAAFFPRTAVIA